MSEYEIEPIPGLPGIPPAGEEIVWQGSPDWRVLARTAFHTRLIAIYFAGLTAWALIAALADGIAAPADLLGTAMTAVLGIVGVALLHFLAWGSARTTIYTLTNRRLVLRIGIAVPKCVNLPFGSIESVGLAARADGTGDVPLALVGPPKLGFLALWPHARAWRVARPEPMLRAIPDAQAIASQIARSCLAANPHGQVTTVDTGVVPAPAFIAAVAA